MTIQNDLIFTILGIGLITGLAAIFIINPKYVVPALVITIPLEISKTIFPFLLLDKLIDGQSVSIMDFSRIITLIVILVWLFRSMLRGKISFPKHKILFWSLILLFYYILSNIFFSFDTEKGYNEIIRLGYHIILLVIIAHFINSREEIELSIKTFIYMGLLISILGVYQFFSGHYFWNAALTNYGMNRINVTYGDPNILARYLSIVIISSLILINKRLMSKKFLLVTFLLSLFALLFTFSRSGWISILIGLIFLHYFAEGVSKKWIRIGGILISVVVFSSFFISNLFSARVSTFSNVDFALGSRSDLILTGIQMYLDHIVFGIGLGSFQFVGLQQYSELLPYEGEYVTLSHTSIVTIMAELGTIGLILTMALFKACFDSFKTIPSSNVLFSYSLISLNAIFIIVISAQGDGRLFEEPLFWLFAGVLIAIERVSKNENMSVK